MTDPHAYQPGMYGWCGFCHEGGGYLGEQGDERSTTLHSSYPVVDENGEREYKRHEGALKSDPQLILWCGGCLGGLKHEFARLSDHNLKAEITALTVWTELDDIHWSIWNADEAERGVLKKYVQDDPAVHLDKLRRERRLKDLETERMRRTGYDLTRNNEWRP